MNTNRFLSSLLILALSLGPFGLAQVFAADQPLLIPGKQSLYQRVLSVPGAQLHATPDGAAGEAVTPFTAFYVYAREPSAGSEWLQVGTDRHGGVRGWLKGPDTIDWA
ncbi:MAG: VWA domain-containing protein, partial [Sedimenticolaceae bacterium]